MAAPIANKVILPLDTGNAGKNMRTQTRVVGADTVHEHFFVPISERSILGNHKFSSGVLTLPTTVQTGAASGLIWVYNPVGSAIKMSIKRLSYKIKFNAIALDTVAGDLRTSRFTTTGVGSAGQITTVKRMTADAAAVGQARTASTGLTVTVLGTAHSNLLPTMDLATGGGGQWNVQLTEWDPTAEGSEIVLVAGEGLVVWNALALTTANRRIVIDGSWDEFE